MESVSAYLDYEGRELPQGHEIVDSVLVEKSTASLAHSLLQSNLTTYLDGYRGPGGQGRPGGWLFGTEADIQVAQGQRYKPDIAGWHIDNAPTDFFAVPILVPPAWVCEILSPSTASRDLGSKKKHYHRANVAHYWLIDPRQKTLTVLRRATKSYEVALKAVDHDRVQAAPFTEIELDLGEFFAQIP